MFHIANRTPFVAAAFILPDARGADTLLLGLKATFSITDPGPGLRIADEQLPIVTADEYAGDPRWSSLTAASEAHLCKPATDVVLSVTARVGWCGLAVR